MSKGVDPLSIAERSAHMGRIRGKDTAPEVAVRRQIRRTSRHTAPMIAPGASFLAAFTPPRAGTFINHVHKEHGDELASGLYAPLIVSKLGQLFEPLTDRVFVIASAGPSVGRAADAFEFINGSAAPDTVVLLAGVTYRLRIIDISANDAHSITLRGQTGPVTCRALARDGRDLPAD